MFYEAPYSNGRLCVDLPFMFLCPYKIGMLDFIFGVVTVIPTFFFFINILRIFLATRNKSLYPCLSALLLNAFSHAGVVLYAVMEPNVLNLSYMLHIKANQNGLAFIASQAILLNTGVTFLKIFNFKYSIIFTILAKIILYVSLLGTVGISAFYYVKLYQWSVIGSFLSVLRNVRNFLQLIDQILTIFVFALAFIFLKDGRQFLTRKIAAALNFVIFTLCLTMALWLIQMTITFDEFSIISYYSSFRIQDTILINAVFCLFTDYLPRTIYGFLIYFLSIKLGGEDDGGDSDGLDEQSTMARSLSPEL